MQSGGFPLSAIVIGRAGTLSHLLAVVARILLKQYNANCPSFKFRGAGPGEKRMAAPVFGLERVVAVQLYAAKMANRPWQRQQIYRTGLIFIVKRLD